MDVLIRFFVGSLRSVGIDESGGSELRGDSIVTISLRYLSKTDDEVTEEDNLLLLDLNMTLSFSLSWNSLITDAMNSLSA